LFDCACVCANSRAAKILASFQLKL
jgi:hypothetical protein